MSSIDETLKERGTRYGEFDEHARVTQNIKSMMADSKNWRVLDDDMKECLEMVAHKLGRILNGDPHYIDSWTDITGYTRLVEKRLAAEQAAVKSLLAGDSADATTFGPLEGEDPKNIVSLEDVLRKVMLSEWAARVTASEQQRQAAGFKAFSVAELDALFEGHGHVNGNT